MLCTRGGERADKATARFPHFCGFQRLDSETTRLGLQTSFYLLNHLTGLSVTKLKSSLISLG